jgi:hypothetical protein
LNSSYKVLREIEMGETIDNFITAILCQKYYFGKATSMPKPH